MKRKSVGLFISMFLVWSIFIFIYAGICAAELVVLKFATVEPPQSFNNKVWAEVFDKINKDGEGILKIDVFAGGTLGRDPLQMLRGLNNGVCDISHIINAYLPGQLLDDQVLNTPFTAQNCSDCTSAVSKMQAQHIMKGYEDLVIIGQICLDQYAIHSKMPVRVPADLKGKKIRTAGKMHNALAEAFGATPVAMPITTVAESISRGVVDGTFSNWEAIKTFRISDVATYHCLVPLGTNSIMVVMTKEKYNSLPSNARAIIDKYKGDIFSNYWAKKADEFRDSLIDSLKKDPKHSVYAPTEQELSLWKAAVEPVVANWDKEQPDWDKLIKAYREGL